MFNELIKESTSNDGLFQKFKKLEAEIGVLENVIKKTDLEIYVNSNILKNFQSVLILFLLNFNYYL